MMTAFDCATEAWWNLAESVTMLYPTELMEFRATNPPPHLGDFMKGTF
jgi:hypothetical protein